MPIRTVKPAGDRKKEIIGVAGRLFQTKGYVNTTVEDVIRESGIAKGTFYYHFSSKETLLRSVLETRLDNLEQSALQIAGHPEWNAKRKLQETLKAIFASGEADRQKNGAGDYEIDPIIHVRLTQMFRQKMEPSLVRIVEQGIQEGEFQVPYPHEVTALLLHGITGYVQDHLSMQGSQSQFHRMMSVIDYVLKSSLQMNNHPENPPNGPY
ncbi:TetR/AcrR family transcriptional regulator [Paenibacillus sp. HN-1]|uniref:TetR/AcrR family transcriptional regulator n=1 Tax=Paenibacillus TaxID=44249 RepID=UPI001CA9B49B|nr:MULTISPECIES: TetR/AcrR family transcriptional regulator [Paenibacillus]MBY9080520.1 TetR/AcrR family transcriptional regulator [Paenibacillus sp. CGMCC 1.18879]MBY9085535.1 TetR/AcrR family transcriptional regulator [Paenibacillus sinensis]